jgi:hypothetical protein
MGGGEVQEKSRSEMLDWELDTARFHVIRAQELIAGGEETDEFGVSLGAHLAHARDFAAGAYYTWGAGR